MKQHTPRWQTVGSMLAVAVAATALAAAGPGGSATASQVVAPAHVCPPAC
jgi:hypothetical protein